MTKRRFSDSESDSPPSPVLKPKKKKIAFRPKVKFEDLPAVVSLDDLISVAETSKWYKNINNIMLWDILPHLKQLQNMIGMKSVKETIFFQVLYYLQGLHLRNTEGDYLHTIISGPPGCGKTTVSKILANIYQSMGILSHGGNRLKIVSREDFVGEYLGSTAVKTKKLLNSCLGGVLFVDELYSLGPGQKDRDSFSKEAIDTINLFLSEHKNDFCFIGAGYKEEIEKCFFSVNQGLKRRFQWYHNIEPYSNEDLVSIFKKMIKEINWEINITDEVLKKKFNDNKEFLPDGGGSCENLLSKIKVCHSIRIFGKDVNEKFKINEKDIDEAFKLLKNNNINKKEKITYDYYT